MLHLLLNGNCDFVSSVVSPDRQILTVTFNDFAPTESLSFVIDIDLAGGIPAAVIAFYARDNEPVVDEELLKKLSSPLSSESLLEP